MKLKQLPDDFFVEELTRPCRRRLGGEFTFYRLDRKSAGYAGCHHGDPQTLEARSGPVFFRRTQRPARAHTVQYLTILHGPLRSAATQRRRCIWSAWGLFNSRIRHSTFAVIDFRLVVRNLSDQQTEQRPKRLDEIRQAGVSQLFSTDQRHGSVSGGSFIGKAAWFWENLSKHYGWPGNAYEFDRAASEARKNHPPDPTGSDWATCHERGCGRGMREILSNICFGTQMTFGEPFARLRPELRKG